MRGLIPLVAFAAAAYFLPDFCYKQTDGFQLTKIHSTLPYNQAFATEAPAKIPLEKVFATRFHYLAAGGQSYAFASEDGKYVLKFFKHHLRRIPWIVDHLPLTGNLASRREKQREKRTKKLIRDFSSYKLSFEQLQEETGLIYIHLNKTTDLGLQARVIDKLGIEHTVNLDTVEFAVQEKGILAYTYLRELLSQGDITGAKKAVEGICDLVIARSKKGIYDDDAKIHRNFGFLRGKPFLIDVGRLRDDPTRKDPKVQKADLEKITYPFSVYLEEVSPLLADHLERYLEEVTCG